MTFSELSFDFITIVVTVAGSWFVMKWRQDRADKDREEDNRRTAQEFEKVWEQIGKNRDWQQVHDKESVQYRMKFQEELSDIREERGQADGKLDSILRRLETIDKKIDKLETREEKRS